MKKLDNRQLARLGALFIAAVAMGWVAWLVATGRAGDLIDAMAHADPRWVIAGMGCFVAYFALDAVCFRISGMLAKVRLGALDLISTAASGIVFGYLTPGNMAAAPAQIVRLSRAGLSVGDASAVQLTRFFIFQAALTLFGATMLLAKFSYFKAQFGNVVIVAALAFLGHLGIMAMLTALVFFPNLVRRVGGLGIRLLSGRVRVIKDPARAHAALEEQIDQYATSVHAAFHHAGVVVSAIVVTLLQLTTIYLVPYFVMLALGATDVDPFTALASAAFVQLVLTAVPLPGGTGGAEGGFYLFFSPMLGGAVGTGVVLWRLISYYLPILVSFPLLACKSRVSPRERERIYGEAQVGVAQIASDARVAKEHARAHGQAAKERAIQQREAARKRIAHARARASARAGGKSHRPGSRARSRMRRAEGARTQTARARGPRGRSTRHGRDNGRGHGRRRG